MVVKLLSTGLSPVIGQSIPPERSDTLRSELCPSQDIISDLDTIRISQNELQGLLREAILTNQRKDESNRLE